MNAKKAKKLRKAIGYIKEDSLQRSYTFQQFPLLTVGGSVRMVTRQVPTTATHHRKSIRKLYKDLKKEL